MLPCTNDNSGAVQRKELLMDHQCVAAYMCQLPQCIKLSHIPLLSQDSAFITLLEQNFNSILPKHQTQKETTGVL